MKHLLGGEVARPVQSILEALPLGHKSLDSRTHRLVGEAQVEVEGTGRIDGGIEHVRPGRDHLRQPRSAAEYIAEQLAQRCVRAQDRQELDRGRHARQRFVEGLQRGVGVAGSGEGFEQRRRQFRQDLPRAGAADRRASAKVPAANGLRGGFRALKAKRAKSCQRRRIVGDASKNKIARGHAELWRVFEQPRVVPLDLGQVMGEVGHKAIEPRITAELGEVGQRLSLEWKALGLLIGDHLQSMFDAAEKRVSQA